MANNTAKNNRYYRDAIRYYSDELEVLKNYKKALKKGEVPPNPEYDDIIKEFGKELEDTWAYEDNRIAAYKCCKNWFNKIISQPSIVSSKPDTGSIAKYDGKYFYYCTDKLEQFFKAKNEDITYGTTDITKFLACYKIGSQNGIQAWIILKEQAVGKWSNRQNEIEKIIETDPEKHVTYDKNKKEKNSCIVTILKDKYLGLPVTDLVDDGKGNQITIEQLIEKNLNEFYSYITNTFESKL